MAALLQGDLLAAWHANALLLMLLPLVLAYAALVCLRLSRGAPQPFPQLPLPAFQALLAVTACFTLARNLAP